MSNLLRTTVLNNEKGNIKFTGADLYQYEISDFFKKLYDLHLRALNKIPIIELDELLSQAHSKKMYRKCVTIYLANLNIFSDEQKVNALDNMVTHFFEYKTNEGFESLFFSTLESTSHFLDYKTIEFYFNKFSTFNWPENIGGGYKTTYMLNKEQDFIGIRNENKVDFDDVKYEVKSYSTLREKLMAKREQTYDITESQCKGYWKLGGAIAFGGLLSVEGPLGTVAGLGVGKEMGEIMGDIYCDKDREIAKDKEAKQEDPENNAEEEEKDSDQNDFEDPEFIEEEETDGCISPYWGDVFIKDPYLNKIDTKYAETRIPYGKGIENFLTKKDNFFKISGLVSIEHYKNNIYINNLGVFSKIAELKQKIINNNELKFNDDDLLKKIKEQQKKLVQQVDELTKIIHYPADKLTPIVLDDLDNPENLGKKLQKELGKKNN